MFRVDEHSNGYFSISIVAMAKTSCYCYVFDPVNDVSGLDNERGEKVRVWTGRSSQCTLVLQEDLTNQLLSC